MLSSLPLALVLSLAEVEAQPVGPQYSTEQYCTSTVLYSSVKI